MPDQKMTRLFWYGLSGITLFRVFTLLFASPNLGPDETQYWFWAQNVDIGYFSKPPLIAWAIAFTTSIFGDATWAVRLSAPFFHAGAAFFLFLVTKEKFSINAGVFTGLIWLTLPGVSLSSILIATDAPMLFFWSAALYFLFRLVDGRSSNDARTAVLLGGAIGAGMLAKYAMIYFPIGVGLAALWFSDFRAKWKFLLISIVIAAVVMAPNIIWNLQNNFSTLSHTSANANWGSDLFSLKTLGDFLGGQFGIAGLFTIAIIASVIGFFKTSQKEQGKAIAPLLCFIAPALLIIAGQAFLSRAHANWAAAAYPAATIFAVAWCLRAKLERWLLAGIAVHLVALLVFSATVVSAPFADQTGVSGAYKRLRGWEGHGASIKALFEEYEASTLMADDREILGGLAYYARGKHSLVAWNSNNKIDDHYEAFHPFTNMTSLPALYVTSNAEAIAVGGHFSSVTKIGTTTASLGGGRSRTLFVFALDGLKTPVAQ